ncbi:MAG: hypothetical protein H8E42_01350 [Nitrospinae bacterium]|nr:hypothetical protein [Nitrospinota bacterium]
MSDNPINTVNQAMADLTPKEKALAYLRILGQQGIVLTDTERREVINLVSIGGIRLDFKLKPR